MAGDSEEKTEQPTKRKLAEARKRGEVAQSKELTGSISFVSVFMLLWLGAEFFQGKLRRVLGAALDAVSANSHAPLAADTVEQMASAALWVVGPVLALVVVAGTIAAFAQNRGIFSTEPLKIKFEKMNPAEALKNLFSTKQLGVLVQMILKLTLLGAVTVITVKNFVGPMILGIYGEAGNASLAGTSAMRLLFGACGLVFVGLGALDFLQQYFEHLKKNKMSKSELKRERKDQEGDPHLRSELRARRREIVDSPARLGVSGASVVITNPTHFAVALYYDGATVELPVVVAKGQDAAALSIRSHATQLAIPVLENPPLARSLFAGVALGEAIGDEHVEAVAEVFRWLARFERGSAQTKV
jgi:type III secretion protein U